MLDKSVPYAGLFMRRKQGAPIPSFTLPEGFNYAFYKDGDETSWAKIEASVLEFDSEFAALMFFSENFIPYRDDLYKRCLFVENRNGEKVATTTAWWSYIEGERRPWLHWVAVDTRFQGLGLGKAVIAHATRLMTELEGDVDIYLKTQTWSYKAVGIYMSCGYEPTNERKLYKGSKESSGRKNSYKKAIRILRRLQGKE